MSEADKMFEELGYIKSKNYSTEYKEKYKKDDDNVYYFDLLHKEYYKSGEWDGMCGSTTMQELQAINKKVEELRMELSEEELDAIEEVNRFAKGLNNYCTTEDILIVLKLIPKLQGKIEKLQKEIKEADEIIDNSIEQQHEREKYTHSLEEKIVKLEKVIDELVYKIYSLKIKLELNNLLEDCFIPREFSDINDCIKKDCKDCIKQYFYRKVEEDE